MKKVLLQFLLIFSIIASSSIAQSASENVEASMEEKGILSEIEYKSDGAYDLVHIKASGYSDLRTEILGDPDRIVIDFENVNVSAGYGSIMARGKILKSIRYSQFTEDTGRVVLDVKKDYDYTIEETDTGLTVYITTAKVPKSDNAIVFAEGSSIKKIGSGLNEAITIDFGSCESYSVSRLTNPETLIVTISNPDVFGADKHLDVDGAKVSYMEYKWSGKSDAVITIGLTAQFQYRAEEREDGLILSLELPSYKNIRYYSNQDRVHFLIKNGELTSGTKNLLPLYTHSRNRTRQVFTATFPTENADIGEGILDINDEHLDSLEVRDNRNGTTSLIFTGNPDNEYLIYTRESGDTAITVIKPATVGQKLVVIDPGHGGTASGAAYGDLIERDINLDMAKRMDSLLKEKGVETYLLRSENTNVDNYERAYIANMLGAKLYISIHNNGTNSKKTDGTMTLYCPSNKKGLTGKDLAQIVQDDMLSMLKTTNRGLRSRPDLIVLRETNMPAVIAEVAFLTNASDRALLRRDDFRQKAAQSLCNSAIKALKEVN